MSSAEIRQVVLDQIAEHAHLEAPRECCGLLVGTPHRVEYATRARNLHSSLTRFLVDPADHVAAIRTARAARLTVVGAYHSHPSSPPVPSPTDQAEATYREFLYLIASPIDSVSPAQRAEADTRGYRLVDGRLQQVTLVVVP